MSTLPWRVQVGFDFDCFCLVGGRISVLLGDGLGGYAAPIDYLVGAGSRFITTSDFDEDGHLDLAVANSDFTSGTAGDVSVLRGDGIGGFASAIDHAAGNSPISISPGDFNEDGHLDLAVANTDSDDVLSAPDLPV